MKTLMAALAAILICAALATAQVPVIGNQPTVFVNAQTGTTYTVLNSDFSNLVTLSNAGAVAVTLPTAGQGGFGKGWYVYVENVGVGTVTITPTTSTVDGAATLVLTTNQGAMLVSNGANYASVRGVSNAGTVTGTGTQNKLTKWAAGGTGVQDSSCTDDATTVSCTEPINSTSGFRVATVAPISNVLLGDGTNFVSGTLQKDKQDPGGAITGDTTDKTVYTYTMPTSTLASGKCLRVLFGFIHPTGSASVTYKISFGATAVFNSGATANTQGLIQATVCNNAASTTAQWALSTGTIANAVFQTQATAPAETTASGTIIVKATFNVAATDQVTGKGWSVELIP